MARDSPRHERRLRPACLHRYRWEHVVLQALSQYSIAQKQDLPNSQDLLRIKLPSPRRFLRAIAAPCRLFGGGVQGSATFVDKISTQMANTSVLAAGCWLLAAGS
jgi:hypothetical protein